MPRFILSLCLCGFFVFTQGERKLKFVQEVFRHGDRVPADEDLFPNDEHKDYWAKFQGPGELTKMGMRMHYDLGAYVRKRYAIDQSFLSQQYVQEEIYVRSTDINRTLMSAYSHLSGLYPPGESQRFHPDIAWQPIPVHTVENREDHLVNPDAKCAYAEKLFLQLLSSDVAQEHREKNKAFYEYVAEKAGTNADLLGVLRVRDTLECEKSHGLSMPAWLDKETSQKMDDSMLLFFKIRYGAPIQARLRGGPLVKAMVDEMKQIVERNEAKGDQKRKLIIYSGHDSTVTAFLGALHVFNNIMPPYAAAVLVELYQDNKTNEFSVHMLYKNDTLPTPLILNGCEEYCPWEKFARLTADILPENWEVECALDVKPLPPSQDWSKSDVILIGVIGLLALIILAPYAKLGEKTIKAKAE